ncbi:hypothetical protein GGX14DRAFT_667667 [Mycena pura]|uniref:Uncharacterized protein n=1 Tax=Mycena pura TaxID=153505 RepID=A0AAD6UY01_9AGAR|nr:hypothetical protein GGX14DRAFT_667667 [Mycena pura]
MGEALTFFPPPNETPTVAAKYLPRRGIDGGVGGVVFEQVRAEDAVPAAASGNLKGARVERGGRHACARIDESTVHFEVLEMVCGAGHRQHMHGRKPKRTLGPKRPHTQVTPSGRLGHVSVVAIGTFLIRNGTKWVTSSGIQLFFWACVDRRSTGYHGVVFAHASLLGRLRQEISVPEPAALIGSQDRSAQPPVHRLASAR